MKKMLILALIGLFYIGISALIPPQKVVVDNDVGYSLTIDQNTNQMIAVSPAPVMDYQIVRGVSVPYKGLISQDALITYNQESFECGIYYTIDRIDFKLSTLTGFEDQPDKYPFASDLGTWERYLKINIA